MTKFIEGAREIEMDAVAKDGKVYEMFCYNSSILMTEGWLPRNVSLIAPFDNKITLCSYD